MWLTGIANLFSVDALIPEPPCIGSSLVPEPVTTAKDDQGWREIGQGRSV
jgi:hypothetical protein